MLPSNHLAYSTTKYRGTSLAKLANTGSELICLQFARYCLNDGNLTFKLIPILLLQFDILHSTIEKTAPSNTRGRLFQQRLSTYFYTALTGDNSAWLGKGYARCQRTTILIAPTQFKMFVKNIAISKIKIAVSQHHKNPTRNSLHVNKKYLYVLQYTHTCVTSGAGRFSSNRDRAHWVMSAVVLPPSYSSASFLVPWAKYLIVGYPLTPYLEAKPWCTVASTAPSFTWNVIENWGEQ